MKKTIFILIGLVLAVSGGWLWHRAAKNLVTLDVQDAEVWRVVKSMRWQTWEDIELAKGVTNRVTLSVRRMPLENVLDLLGQQTGTRWVSVYPLYRKGNVEQLKAQARGEGEANAKQWTNFSARAGFGGRGMLMPNLQVGGSGVSVQIQNKDLPLAALAISRNTPAQVVAENGLTRKVTLELKEVPLEEAVKKLAKEAKADWDHFYVLLPGRGGGPGMGMARSVEGENNRENREGTPRPRGAGFGMGRMDELLETMPPEERARAIENRQRMEQMREMTPEQRQQAMAERGNNPEMQQQMQQRQVAGIKNSTPEQRRERFERIYEMRKARANGQQPGFRR